MKSPGVASERKARRLPHEADCRLTLPVSLVARSCWPLAARCGAADLVPTPGFQPTTRFPQTQTPPPRRRVARVPRPGIPGGRPWRWPRYLAWSSGRGAGCSCSPSSRWPGWGSGGKAASARSAPSRTSRWPSSIHATRSAAAVIAIFALPLVFTLFFGRSFCASVCPLGAVQELVAVRPVQVPAVDRSCPGTAGLRLPGSGRALCRHGLGLDHLPLRSVRRPVPPERRA